jgi:outer membrane protein OmpA-like peptidoglycan-associated protein
VAQIALAAIVFSIFSVSVSAILGISFTPKAQAQLHNAPIDLQIFRPAMDSKGFITLNSSGVLGLGDFSFGLVTTWASKPLTLNGAQTFGPAPGQNNRFAVNDIITPSLQGAVGLTNLSHFGLELGVVVPMAVLAGRGDPTDPGPSSTNLDDKVYTFTQQGLGDITVHPKIRLLNATRTGLGIAVIPTIILPTGDKSAFLGEGQTIFHPSVVIDTEFGYLGRFRAGINAGIKLRGKASSFIDDANSFPRAYAGAPSNTGLGISIKNEYTGGVALSYGIVPQKFDVVAELYGLMGPNSYKIVGGNVTTDKLGPAAEAIGGIKLYLARNSFFEVGGGWRVLSSYGSAAPRAFIGFIFEPSIGDRDGDGINDDVDKCPDDPEDKDNFEDEDGCPDPDNDKDGIPDVNDLCPNDPEDKDGFEDQDGCPDPDNDHDRILDVNDKCPNEPETYNGVDDEDGCPDKGRVIVRKGKLEILDKIYFETDKTDIKSESFPLLDAIAATLKGNPQIQLVEIQGHADERGNDEHNLELTEGRSASVKKALVQRGIEPSSLKNHGYGETKPLCTQHNEDCWSKNRRVEFIILRRTDETQLQGGEGQ